MEYQTWKERLDVKPDDMCGTCGYPLFCFIGDDQYRWCPNCLRDDGSGKSGGVPAASRWW